MLIKNKHYKHVEKKKKMIKKEKRKTLNLFTNHEQIILLRQAKQELIF